MTASPASTHGAVHHRACGVQPQLCPNLSAANCREMMDRSLRGFKLASCNWEAPSAAALLKKVFVFHQRWAAHSLVSAFGSHNSAAFSLHPAGSLYRDSKGCSSLSLHLSHPHGGSKPPRRRIPGEGATNSSGGRQNSLSRVSNLAPTCQSLNCLAGCCGVKNIKRAGISAQDAANH